MGKAEWAQFTLLEKEYEEYTEVYPIGATRNLSTAGKKRFPGKFLMEIRAERCPIPGRKLPSGKGCPELT